MATFPVQGRLSAIKASVRKAGVNEVEIIRMLNISSTNWHYTINFDTHMHPPILIGIMTFGHHMIQNGCHRM